MMCIKFNTELRIVLVVSAIELNINFKCQALRALDAVRASLAFRQQRSQYGQDQKVFPNNRLKICILNDSYKYERTNTHAKHCIHKFSRTKPNFL